MRKTGVLLCALATLVATPASARPTRLQRAEAIADSYYPASPCAGRVSIVPVTQAHLDAFWPGHEAGMVAVAASCSIEVAWSAWDGAPWRQVCRGLVHEFGHLDGLEHSANRSSVMFPQTFDIAQGSMRCWLAFPDPTGFYSARDLQRARARAFLRAHPHWRH